jgi:hypothetical protein
MAAFEVLESRRLFSGGPDGGGPEPIFPDDLEPNNSFAAATNLGTTNTAGRYGLTLHNQPVANDVDYFKFTAATSGTVGIVIEFVHVQGNMQLVAYDAAQQQIALSNTSTPANGREGVAIAVTAGQTYYIKAAGSGAAPSQPDYFLEMQPVSVAFDYTMPSRFGAARDEFGYPVIPNTPDYARPAPVIIGGVETPTFPVRLDASASSVGSTGATFNWHIASAQYTTDFTGGPILTASLPEGQYDVTLTVNLPNAPALVTSRAVKVQDHLIVVMGDGYASGEAIPNQTIIFNNGGFIHTQAQWARGDNAALTLAHRRAHRSGRAGAVSAAVELENADPKSSVTFIMLSHSGATVPTGLFGAQGTSQPDEPGTDAAQFDQLASIVGSRRIDGLVLSVGWHDAQVPQTMTRLMQAEPGSANYASTLQAIWNDAFWARRNLSQVQYPAVAQHLATHFNVGQVFLTEYPDVTRDASGNTAAQIMHDIYEGKEVDQNELNEARSRLLTPLAQDMAAFARQQGWQYVDDVASAFATHGYGDWIRTADDSVALQGPVFNIYFVSPDERANTLGTLHPNSIGQSVYRSRTAAAFTKPNLIATNFALAPGAFVAGATDGYTLTVKNTSLTARAAQNVSRIYLSADPTISTSDTGVLDVTVPALDPGQSVTLTGVLPHITDPIRAALNIEWVGVLLDVNNTVPESSDKDNAPIGTNDLAMVEPEQDLHFDGFDMLFDGTNALVGGTYNAGLGLDELIGQYDMDIYAFTVANAGQRLAFDVDALAPAAGLDTYVRLYPMQGNTVVTGSLLASNDDARAPGEPTAGNGESYLAHTFAAPGRYALVVSHAANASANPMLIPGRSPGAEGQYALTIAEAPAPQPVTVSDVQFEYLAAPQRLRFDFSANVQASLGASDLQVRNLTTNELIPSDRIAVSYDAQTNRAAFTFPGYAYGALPDGKYRATLPAGSVSDGQGNTLAGDVEILFDFLNGDANRDGRVNLADFNILAANFGQTNRNFAQGDFTYDGQVNLADFNVLAGRFGAILTPSTTSGTPDSGGAPTASAPARGVGLGSEQRDALRELLG